LPEILGARLIVVFAVNIGSTSGHWSTLIDIFDRAYSFENSYSTLICFFVLSALTFSELWDRQLSFTYIGLIWISIGC
jgi:hypothetical protein